MKIGYGATFWYCCRRVYEWHAVSEVEMCRDLGLALTHFRNMKRKLGWPEHPKTKTPGIPLLTRQVDFYLSHSLDAKHMELVKKLRAEIKDGAIWHRRLVQRALCFKYGEFTSLAQLDAHAARYGGLDAFLDGRDGRKHGSMLPSVAMRRSAGR